MKLNLLLEKIEDFAPLSLAESWDNPGLIVGDPEQDITGAVLCLDVTEKAFQMCRETGAQLCLCHHPFLFDAIKKIDFSDPYFQLLRKFIQADIAIYAAHTNLDACVGGVNDALSDLLGLDVAATFLPKEIPFDFQKTLVPGIGRICVQREKTSLFDFYYSLMKKLQTSGCHINFDHDRTVGRILVAGGSYDSLWNRDVLDNHIDVVLSGEIKHRDMVFFDRYGIAAIAAGHDATERPILQALARRMDSAVREVAFAVCPSVHNRVV